MRCQRLRNNRNLPLILFLIFSVLFVSCAESRKERLPWGDLTIYRKTNDELGHEFVKTEQFIVPVGTIIPIEGLEYDAGITNLTTTQERILQQVFNSIEEVTENTMGDTDLARVGEFKKMSFEIRGYGDGPGNAKTNLLMGQARANAALVFLTRLGTPAWRLHATTANGPAGTAQNRGRIVFVRTR